MGKTARFVPFAGISLTVEFAAGGRETGVQLPDPRHIAHSKSSTLEKDDYNMNKEQQIIPPSEQDTIPLDLSRFQKPEEEALTSPYTRKSEEVVQTRKSIVKKLQRRFLFPIEKVPHSIDCIEEAKQMRQEGYAFIVPYSHADRRGPVDVMTTLISLGEGFEDAEYMGPIAVHQQKSYIDYLSTKTAIPLAPIVTEETVKRAENKKSGTIFSRTTHRKSITEPEQLRAGQGLLEYAERAGRILAHDKGIVFVAPQGGRRPQLDSPAGRAVEMLIRSAEREGADRIAIWPMGILQKKNKNLKSGINIGRMINVEFEEPITVTELRRRAEENSKLRGEKFTLDQQVFEELAKVLPPSYVNRKEAK